VVAAEKTLSVPDVESIIEIRDRNGKLIFSKDYSSEDGLHGLGVVQCQWTPDSQFFVYSLTSSGADRPWYSPIDIYSRSHNAVERMDDMIGNRPTLSAGFDIFPPHWIEDVTWKDASHAEDYVTVKVDLAAAFSHPGNGTSTNGR